jgi:hypothetical protein
VKKHLKKLSLSRETLRSLKENVLVPAIGGGSGAFGTLCECTYLNCSEKCFHDPGTAVGC